MLHVREVDKEFIETQCEVVGSDLGAGIISKLLQDEPVSAGFIL